MTIDSYSTLVSAIGDTLNRADLASVIPTWVSMADADLSGRVRHPNNELQLTISGQAEFVALPTDWRETKSLAVDATGGRCPVHPVPDYEIDGFGTGTGSVTHFSQVGNFLRLWPAPTADTEATLYLRYWQALPALTASNPNNWLLLHSPDAYLYGALVHSAPYLEEDARVAAWGQLYERALSRIDMEARKSNLAEGITTW